MVGAGVELATTGALAGSVAVGADAGDPFRTVEMVPAPPVMTGFAVALGSGLDGAVSIGVATLTAPVAVDPDPAPTFFGVGSAELDGDAPAT